MLRLAGERKRLSIVDDQFGSPTSSIELARVTRTITEGVLTGQFGSTLEWAGIYHTTCANSTSWFSFAKAIFTGADALLNVKQPELTPLATKDDPTPAKRPRISILSNQELYDRFSVRLTDWQTALDDVLQILRTADPTPCLSKDLPPAQKTWPFYDQP